MSNSFKDLDKLLSTAEKMINRSLNKEVKEQVKRTLKENIITEVYVPYTPTSYDRTGGLYQDSNIEAKINGNTLTVRSSRSEGNRDIANIIEYGQGYYAPELDEKIGERPFHHMAGKELKENELIEKAMVKGLESQGLRVRLVEKLEE